MTRGWSIDTEIALSKLSVLSSLRRRFEKQTFVFNPWENENLLSPRTSTSANRDTPHFMFCLLC